MSPDSTANFTPFLLRLSRVEPPAEHGNDEDARIDAQYRTWSELFSNTTSRAHDAAAYYTQATILDAAIHAVGERLWITFDDEYAVSVLNGRRMNVDDLAPLAVSYGTIDEIPEHAPDLPGWAISSTAAPAFTHQRKVTSFLDDLDSAVSSGGLSEEMIRLAQDGVDFVHIRLRSGRSEVVPVSTAHTQNLEALVDAFGWDLMRFHHVIDAVIVSPVLTMTCEYRVWVIGNAVVTGAGIVPGSDPRQNLGSAFDPNVIGYRYSGDAPGIMDPATIEVMVEVVRSLANDNAHGGDLPEDFVADVAIVGGLPTLVDLNQVDGSALYAADPDRIIRAIASRRPPRR